MKLIDGLPFRTALCGLTLMATTVAAQQKYCSNQNTGSGSAPIFDRYQSNGACYDSCKAQYAFAIVQDSNCWCSNYIPADQQSIGDCNQDCPGYPDDSCGNQGQGLFGYIALPNEPSGTMGGSSSAPPQTSSPDPQSSDPPASSPPPPPSSTPDPPPSSTPEPETNTVSKVVTQTVTDTQKQSTKVVVSTVTPTPESTYAPPPTSNSYSLYASSSISSSSSSSSSSSPSPSPSSNTHSAVTSVRVTTIHGSVVTQTVTTTPVVVSGGNVNDTPKMTQNGLSPGAIAAVVIGVLVAVAALLVGAFLLWRRKKNTDDEGGFGSGGPKRTTSVLSKTGLLSRVRPQSMAENTYDESYSTNQLTRPNSVRHSMMFGATVGEGVSPVSPLGSSADQDSNRRHSKPMVYDQRLNPSALFANHDNSSRVSMQDQQDYSRPLGIANPDTRHSFDSR